MENLDFMVRQLKAVSDLNRLKLLACLKNGEVCACDFVDILNISQPAVSRHLKKLKEANILTERPDGTWKYYCLVKHLPKHIQLIIDELEEISIVSCNCGTMLSNSCDN